MSSDDEDVRTCPYRFCGAFLVMLVEQAPPGSETWIKRIPRHDIEHAVLTGPCHASLLAVGWTPGTPLAQSAQTMLLDREAVDNAKIPGLLTDEATRQHEESLRRTHERPDGSYSLRGPHRIGREPVTPEDESAWHLHGRQDEDSGHIALPTRQDNPIPAYVQGTEVGRHVASAEEVVGHLTTANINAGAASHTIVDTEAQLQSAIGALDSCKGNIRAAMGNLSPQLLQMYFSLIEQAQGDLQSCIPSLRQATIAIANGQQNGTEFIGRLTN